MDAMENYDADALIRKPEVIRNIAVLGNIGHGKSTLVDSVLMKAGVIATARNHSSLTEGVNEDTCSANCKLAVFSFLGHSQDDTENNRDGVTNPDGNEVFVNIIDTPGHADLFAEVTAAITVTDAAIVTVDVIDGVRMQTETILRHALMKGVKPVIMMNKLDRALLETQVTKEDLYQLLSRNIDQINAAMPSLPGIAIGPVQVSPNKGSIAFGSGLYNWAFTLDQFAAKYAAKFGIDRAKLTKRLWGEHYFNPYTKTWVKEPYYEGKPLERSFNRFILDPIFKIHATIMHGSAADIVTILDSLKIELSPSDRSREGKQLLKVVMKSFLPAADAIMDMIRIHLPSPATAQKYRTELLYDGSMETDAAIGVVKCSATSPLVIYISKMIPTSTPGTFYAFGRVFSGTAISGLPVEIQCPDGTPSGWTDRFRSTISQLFLNVGTEFKRVNEVPAGNLIALSGFDQYLLRYGLIATGDIGLAAKAARRTAPMTLQYSVQTANAQDLPKLVEGFKCLSKFDNDVQTSVSDSGEYIIAGRGELHLEICLQYLKKQCSEATLVVSGPTIQYQETVQQASSRVALSKSPNKHSRLYMTAEPMGEELLDAIENGVVSVSADHKVRASHLANEFNWDITDGQKLWAFSPAYVGANLLVDQTKQVQYLYEIRDSVVAGFQWATRAGPIAEEPIRSVRFNLMDVMLNSDAIHRGAGQIMPTSRRVLYASMLLANPALLEPVYTADFQVPREAISAVRKTLSRRRGCILSEQEHFLENIFNINASLPAMETLGIREELASNLSFAQLAFSGWQICPGSPLDAGTTAGKVVAAIRKRKGIKGDIPIVDMFNDKL